MDMVFHSYSVTSEILIGGKTTTTLLEYGTQKNGMASYISN